MTNWNQLFDDISAEKKKSNTNNYAKKIYLNSDVGSNTFIKLTTDVNGELFRSMFYHRVPVSYTDKDDNAKTSNRILLCKGRDCPLCSAARDLESAGIKESYKYKASLDILAVGVVANKVQGIGFTPATNDKGEAEVGVVFLSAIGRVNRAFQDFIKPASLLGLGDIISELDGLSGPDVLKSIFDQNGYVMKVSPRKNDNNHWTTTMTAVNGRLNIPGEIKIDLMKDIYPEEDMKDELYESAIENLGKVYKQTLEYRKAKVTETSDEESVKKANPTSEYEETKVKEDVDNTPETEEDDNGLSEMDKAAMALFG